MEREGRGGREEEGIIASNEMRARKKESHTFQHSADKKSDRLAAIYHHY